MTIRFKTQLCEDRGLRLDDFVPDRPLPPAHAAPEPDAPDVPGAIVGVSATPLVANSDERGWLFELLTTRDGGVEPIVHIYQVFAVPGSIRAWIYHRHQFDRLAFTQGQFEVALYDIRPDSPTANRVNFFAVGAAQPCLIRIPPFVVHGVRNAGPEESAFVNMPTKAYDRNAPDKARILFDDSRVPFVFDER
jgi:dTDP-4-dehydrorhamnose 3,5-epimerase